DRRDEVLEAALSEGLLTLGCGKRSLRLLPPLDVTDRELDLALECLETALDSVATHRVRST
ncbi:4-aminobutyrate aminotransferase, partial [Haloferax sp. BAB-2207]